MSSFDTIYNDPDPPLADIVPFRFSLSLFPPQGFKTHLVGEGFHTLIKGRLFSFPTNVGHHTGLKIYDHIRIKWKDQVSKSDELDESLLKHKNFGLYSFYSSKSY